MRLFIVVALLISVVLADIVPRTPKLCVLEICNCLIEYNACDDAGVDCCPTNTFCGQEQGQYVCIE
jgi:hypothetical protein